MNICLMNVYSSFSSYLAYFQTDYRYTIDHLTRAEND